MVAPNWLQRHKGQREPFSWCWVKKGTQQPFSRNHWGLEREIQKIDLQAIRGGNEIRTGAAALLCCYSFPCISTQAQTHTHRAFWRFSHQSLCSRVEGKPHCPAHWGGKCVVPVGCTKLEDFMLWKWGRYPRPIKVLGSVCSANPVRSDAASIVCTAACSSFCQGYDSRAQPGLGCWSRGCCLLQWGWGEDSVHQQGEGTQALEKGMSVYFRPVWLSYGIYLGVNVRSLWSPILH